MHRWPSWEQERPHLSPSELIYLLLEVVRVRTRLVKNRRERRRAKSCAQLIIPCAVKLLVKLLLYIIAVSVSQSWV